MKQHQEVIHEETTTPPETRNEDQRPMFETAINSFQGTNAGTGPTTIETKKDKEKPYHTISAQPSGDDEHKRELSEQKDFLPKKLSKSAGRSYQKRFFLVK